MNAITPFIIIAGIFLIFAVKMRSLGKTPIAWLCWGVGPLVLLLGFEMTAQHTFTGTADWTIRHISGTGNFIALALWAIGWIAFGVKAFKK